SFGRKKARNYDRIQIDKIEKTGNLEEITCISVENEEQLYLTSDFIVTHNTAYAINLAIEMLQKQPDVQIDFFTSGCFCSISIARLMAYAVLCVTIKSPMYRLISSHLK